MSDRDDFPHARAAWRHFSDTWAAALAAERTKETECDEVSAKLWDKVVTKMAEAVEAFEEWARYTGKVPGRLGRGRALPEAPSVASDAANAREQSE